MGLNGLLMLRWAYIMVSCLKWEVIVLYDDDESDNWESKAKK